MPVKNVRVRNGFSDRNGFSPISKEMVLTYFPEDVKNALWINLKNLIDDQFGIRSMDKKQIAKCICENLFNEEYQDFTPLEYVLDDVRDTIMESSFDVILTIVEFITRTFYISKKDFDNLNSGSFYHSLSYINTFDEMNNFFKEEYIGYRFIDGKITKITSEEEIESINKTIKTKYDGVNEAFSKAVGFISETGKQDYKKCIEHSILALETLLNCVLNTSGLVLSNAINQYCDKQKIHTELKESIIHLYKYTNEIPLIRHGNNKEDCKVTFDDAKFVLVTVSGFINYIMSNEE